MLRISMVVRRGAHLGSTLTTVTTFLCVPLKLRRSRPLLLIVVLPCACRSFLYCMALLSPRQPLVACQLLIVVANVGLWLHLPHKSRFRVASRDAEPDLPHEKGWNSRGLTIGCYLLWQMLGYSCICHTKMEFVWQTAV